MTAALLHLLSLVRFALFPLAAYVLAVRFSERPIATWLRATLAGLTVLAAIFAIASVASATRPIGEWDFLCFWLYGHAAAAGANVYAPATYQAMALPISIDTDFQHESIDVGFPYPPASILLFLPLGYLTNFPVASVLWLAVMIVALVAGAVVLIRTYVPARDFDAAVAIAALALGLPAVYDNIVYHQTNFLALALLAAAYTWRGGFGGGVAAALAVVVKPYLAVVMLWFALRRRWKALGASVATFALVSLAAIPALGPGGVRTFFVSNPATRLPPYLYVEAQTASLYAFLLRLAHREGALAGTYHDPAYVAIALALAAVTVWLAATATERDDDLSLALTVALGLMLYPGTGTMYAVALVPAFVALARTVGQRQPVAFALFALVFFIANRSGGSAGFVAIAALWLGVAILLWIARGRTDVRSESVRGAAATA
jgi:alpha-1,2-mannosyltransferase